MRLNIVLWWWKGWRPVYARPNVNAVATMLRERANLPKGARIICLTDQQTDWFKVRSDALGVETLPLWADPVPNMPAGRPNCFRRLKIFDPNVQDSLGIGRGELIMSMDLDSIVCGSIRPLLVPLELTEDGKRPAYTFAAMGGIAARIHGSLFAFHSHTHANVWSEFHPKTSPQTLAHPDIHGRMHIGSDQAWLSRQIAGEFLWERAHGCYSWNRHGMCFSPRYTQNQVYWSFAGIHKPDAELVRQVRPDLHSIYLEAIRKP